MKSFPDDIFKSIWKEMNTGNISPGMRKTNLSKHKQQISFPELQGSNTCDSEPIKVYHTSQHLSNINYGHQIEDL